MIQPVFTLKLEATPGSTFADLCAESQRLADMLFVTVNFYANGVTCIARPGGSAIRLFGNLELMIGKVHPPGNKVYAFS
jgi:hypothetical protein